MNNTFHLDGNFQKTIDKIYKEKLSSVKIVIAPGDYSDEDILLYDNIGWVIEGSVSGACLLGNIKWCVSGDINPLVPQSYLLLRNSAPKSLVIFDGDIPAKKSLLALENSAILGDVLSVGYSFIVSQISGISTSSSTIAGNNVSSLILGKIDLKHNPIVFTNTQINNNVISNQISANGCQFNGSTITVNKDVSLYNCNFTQPQKIICLNDNGGVLYVDRFTHYQLTKVKYDLINCSIIIEG